MTSKRQMKLGFSMAGNGSHKAGWRHPKSDTSSTQKFRVWKEMTQALEKAKIHFMFLADGAAVRSCFTASKPTIASTTSSETIPNIAFITILRGDARSSPTLRVDLTAHSHSIVAGGLLETS